MQLGQNSAPYKSALYSVAGNKRIVQVTKPEPEPEPELGPEPEPEP